MLYPFVRRRPAEEKDVLPELPRFFRTSRTGNASVTPSPYGPSNAGDSGSRFESARTFAIAPVPAGQKPPQGRGVETTFRVFASRPPADQFAPSRPRRAAGRVVPAVRSGLQSRHRPEVEAVQPPGAGENVPRARPQGRGPGSTPDGARNGRLSLRRRAQARGRQAPHRVSVTITPPRRDRPRPGRLAEDPRPWPRAGH